MNLEASEIEQTEKETGFGVYLGWPKVKTIGVLAFRTLERLLDTGQYRTLAVIMAGLLIAWHLYTPIHELLHVAGCVFTGGTVEELALKPQYGGTVLQHVFPFITPESDYAGQLTGFSTPNKWSYAVVDFLPFVLSIPAGLLMVWCYRNRNTWLFGLALILAFVPIMSITGDFFEGASLVTSEMLSWMEPSLGDRFLISDDMFKLVGELMENQQMTAMIGFMIAVTFLLGTTFIYLLMFLQGYLVHKLYGEDILSKLANAGADERAKATASKASTVAT